MLKKLLTALFLIVMACLAFSLSIDASPIPFLVGITQELPFNTYVSGSYGEYGLFLVLGITTSTYYLFDCGITANYQENNSRFYLNGKAGLLYIHSESDSLNFFTSEKSQSISNGFGFILKGSINFNIIGNFGIGLFCNIYTPFYFMNNEDGKISNEFKFACAPSLGLSINLF